MCASTPGSVSASFTRRVRSTSCSGTLGLSYREEVRGSTNEDRPARKGERCPHRLADGVRAQHLVFRSGLDEKRVAVVARLQDVVAERDQRRAEGGGHRGTAAFVHEGPGQR